jgi:hypothetical protein
LKVDTTTDCTFLFCTDFGSASNNYRVKLHFDDENEQAYFKAKDFLRDGDWKLTLVRGNAYQARYIGPDGVDR